MGAIKGLLKKDLYNLSSYKASLILTFIMLPIVCITISDIGFITPVITMMLGMMVISTFSYDDASKANKYINALPNTKKEVVKEKYILAMISVLLGGVIGSIVTILVGNIIMIVNPHTEFTLDYSNIIIETISWILGIYMMQSIQLPLIYKYGSEKSRIIMILLAMIVGGIIIFVQSLIPTLYHMLSVQIPQNLYTWIVNGAIILIAIMMYMISFHISYKAYSKKDI